MKLDQSELARLRELEAKATDAPWVHGADDDPPSEDIHAESGGAIAMVWPHANVRTVMRHGENFSHADARLIAAARNSLPALLAAADENERLRTLLAEAKSIGGQGVHAAWIHADKLSHDSVEELGELQTKWNELSDRIAEELEK